MKLAHLNFRSMFTGFNNFVQLLNKKKIDIVAITETWLNNLADMSFFNIPGYNLSYKHREYGRGGGVMFYVKSTLKFETITFDFEINEKLEFLFLKIFTKHLDLGIGVFYRPPNTNIKNFISDFDNMLNFFVPTVDEVILLGDLNVNFFEVDNVVNECFSTYNLVQVLNEPTRQTIHTATLLDPIFTTNCDMISTFGTIDCRDISDHKLVYCCLNISIFSPKVRIITQRQFKGINIVSLLADLEKLNWHGLILESDIEKKIKMFNSYLTSLFDVYAPFRSVRVTKRPAPWLNQPIILKMKERDSALQKYKKSRLAADFEYYKQLRNETLSMVRQGQKNIMNNIATEKNQKKLWKTLKQLNLCKNNKVDIPQNLSDPNDINMYFSNFLRDISNDNCKDQINHYLNNISSLGPNVFSFKLASIDEVSKALDGIKSHAVGYDNISLLMLNFCRPFIDKYLTHLINATIEKSHFPSAWKISVGKPLPKVSNPTDFSDLRIISILPVLSKVLEKILFSQLSEFFTKNNILPQTQAGFRKGYSTASALAAVTDEIIDALDKKESSLLVLLDYSRAFDTINHKLLCAKFKYYGAAPSAVSLIFSYLSNRTQVVEVDGVKSNAIDILSGVPQGSILGPLLFIFYTADILMSVKNGKVRAYADDTQLSYRFLSRDINETCRGIDGDLEHIYDLSKQHNLKLNSEKSKVIIFTSKTSKHFLTENAKVHINGVPLPIVDESRNLGVVFDNELRFRTHVRKLMQKCYTSLKFIYANRALLSRQLRKHLCESLVLSHFTYCDFIYFFCLDAADKKRIQRVQNSCCRIIFGLRKFDHVTCKIGELNWLRMENRVRHHLGTFIHKQISTSPPNTLTEKFVPRRNIHSVNIRNPNYLTMPLYFSALYLRSFTYNSVSLYNSVPVGLKSLKVSTFKLQYKKYLLSLQQSNN